MAQQTVHLRQYETFRQDAFNESISPSLRVEAMFLGAYHLIDACAARVNTHTGKHQNIRKEVEANPSIFGEETHSVWRAFQDLETRVRPKFVYGLSWSQTDLDAARSLFQKIEALCHRVLKP